MHEECLVETEPSSYDFEYHVEASDHLSREQELPSPRANTDDEFDVDKVPVSPKDQNRMEISEQPVHEEYPLETEARDETPDDFQHDTDIPDTVDATDDVPVSPVEQSAQDIARESEQTSFYYTEPQIRLREDLEHESVMELPVATTDSATDANNRQSDVEQPHTEGSSQDAAEEPFDPIQSWGPPMGLPAPLNNENNESGKKRESKGDASRGGAASAKDRSLLSAPRTDAKTTSSGKTGAAQDLSGGRNGRTSAKPGKPTERPAATRKPTAASTDARKVGICPGLFYYQLH